MSTSLALRDPVAAEAVHGAIMALASDFSIETTPRQAARIESFAALLPKGTRVFIAFVAGEAPAAAIALAERLVLEGMVPVPHVPARSFGDLPAVRRFLAGLRAAGAAEALVLAGGQPQPSGVLESGLELLASGMFEDLGFRQLFVAGHPGGSPDIGPDELARALAAKNEHAARTGTPMTIVTQFVFEPAPVLAWARAIARAGNVLPVRLGVPGPASVASLVRYARLCGVEVSMAMLAKIGGRLFRLAGQAAPDRLIRGVAAARMREEGAISALHFFPFGGFADTAAFAGRLKGGRFVAPPDGRGFALLD